MKLVVLGANGRTGEHVVTAALAHGHEVVAVLREDAKMRKLNYENLLWQCGVPVTLSS